MECTLEELRGVQVTAMDLFMKVCSLKRLHRMSISSVCSPYLRNVSILHQWKSSSPDLVLAVETWFSIIRLPGLSFGWCSASLSGLAAFLFGAESSLL